MLNSKENFGGSGFGRYAHPASKPLSWPERKYHSKALPESLGNTEADSEEEPKNDKSGDESVLSDNEVLPETNNE